MIKQPPNFSQLSVKYFVIRRMMKMTRMMTIMVYECFIHVFLNFLW